MSIHICCDDFHVYIAKIPFLSFSMWMNRIATVDPSDTVVTAAKRMQEQRTSCAVITVDNKPRGILT